MRSKSFYIENEIVNNLYTTGSEWTLTDGTEYIGLYHQYTTGETYTEPEWNSKLSKKLIKYVQQPKIVQEYNSLKLIRITSSEMPRAVVPNISISDIQIGYINRFFIKKVNELNIIEIDQQQYNDYSTIFDIRLYSVVKIKWFITGNLQDSYENNVMIPGILSKNSKEVHEANSMMPGIVDKLTNLQEYYINSNIQTPTDINTK